MASGEPLPREEGESDALAQLDQALEENCQAHYKFIYSVSREDEGLEGGDLGASQVLERELRVLECEHQEEGLPQLDSEVIQELEDSGFTHFAFSTVREITNNFSDQPQDLGGNKLGEGAFGVVYKARVVVGGQEKWVAVKKLSSGENKVEEQFKTEIEVLSRLALFYLFYDLIPACNTGLECRNACVCERSDLIVTLH